MIITKATVFFTALAVSTFSAISAQTSSTPVDDLVVEIDTAIPKTTKMPKNKKGKKGGKAVHTKSEKKGKKSTSPSSSPTGACEYGIVILMSNDIRTQTKSVADYMKLIDADPTLSQIKAVGDVLDQAALINSVVKSTLYGDATGCDYDASLEVFDSLPSRRHLEEEDVRPTSAGTSGSEVGRKLQDDPRALISELAQAIITLFLSSVIEFDKLNKNYPLYMGLLGEITCTYYKLSLVVVDIVWALSENTVDLSSFHEDTLRSMYIVYEEGGLFPEVFNIPTVFDAAACGL